ncbi:MAG: hypothetical protein QOF30_384 [Acidimicrobiaceae bacterium]|jgi:hypothetical protein|nr:hypothetical protein [Acidimicrobiaceae bacterium]
MAMSSPTQVKDWKLTCFTPAARANPPPTNAPRMPTTIRVIHPLARRPVTIPATVPATNPNTIQVKTPTAATLPPSRPDAGPTSGADRASPVAYRGEGRGGAAEDVPGFGDTPAPELLGALVESPFELGGVDEGELSCHVIIMNGGCDRYSFPADLGAPTLAKATIGGSTAGGSARKRFVQPLNGHRRGRLLAIVGILVLLLVPVTWSYGHALRAAGNTAVSVRSVEWLKDHHFTWLVNDVENFWYTHHKPKKGGTPTGGLAAAMRAGATSTTSTSTTLDPGLAPAPSAPELATAAFTGRALPAPRPIRSIAANPLPGEGDWSSLGQPVAGKPAMYATYVRPDAVYTSLVTGVAWIDPNLVKFDLFAGVQEPGGRDWHHQAPMGPGDRANLVAAFNSGFKLKDSEGGYYADGRTVRTLRDGAATLAINPNGVPSVGQWGRDLTMGPSVAFARQNLSLVVDNGQPVPGLNTDSNYKWGATLGNKVLVWRSGVGVTSNGALVYVAGNSLSISMLASVLSRAGAVRAMELDINSAWVEFVSYGPAIPSPAMPDTKLLPDMSGGTSRYLGDNSRDFVAVFRRA